jgi:hypothetical protein
MDPNHTGFFQLETETRREASGNHRNLFLSFDRADRKTPVQPVQNRSESTIVVVRFSSKLAAGSGKGEFENDLDARCEFGYFR